MYFLYNININLLFYPYDNVMVYVLGKNGPIIRYMLEECFDGNRIDLCFDVKVGFCMITNM